MIEAILIDIDGCLLPTDGSVSPNFYRGLSEFSFYVKESNKGSFPKIGFCTGRDRNYVEAVCLVVGLPQWWSIIESGLALFNAWSKELVFNPALSSEIRETFKEISKERISKILGKCSSELFLYPGKILNVSLERFPKAKSSIEQLFEIVKNELQDLLRERKITISHSNIAVDISPAGIDKASGVKFLAQYTGIDLKKTLGIGDSNGDFPMLEQVGYIGCPSNASEEVKEVVKKRKGYISSLPFVEGVVDVIRYFADKKG